MGASTYSLFGKNSGSRALAITFMSRSARTEASSSQKLSTVPHSGGAISDQTDAGNSVRRGRICSASAGNNNSRQNSRATAATIDRIRQAEQPSVLHERAGFRSRAPDSTLDAQRVPYVDEKKANAPKT